jgi:putative ABC transport system permease protein
MTLELILNGLSQGLILSIVTYAIMFPFRFLDFTDLSSEGTYPLGGAIFASSLALLNLPIGLALTLGVIGACSVGLCTALISLKLKVNSMLSGIILSTMAYSVNLRIMGKPNIALFGHNGLFNLNIYINILILLIILLFIIIFLSVFLRTDFRLRFRAIGLNPRFAKKQQISITKNTILGLLLAGGLSGLAGGLMVLIQSYMDIGMGVGILIHALASLMIGEAIIGNHTLNRQLLAPLLGTLVYQQFQGIALSIGLSPTDLKFFTGSIVLSVVTLQKIKSNK